MQKSRPTKALTQIGIGQQSIKGGLNIGWVVAVTQKTGFPVKDSICSATLPARQRGTPMPPRLKIDETEPLHRGSFTSGGHGEDIRRSEQGRLVLLGYPPKKLNAVARSGLLGQRLQTRTIASISRHQQRCI